MTTTIDYRQFQQVIPNLTSVSEEGWHLAWGSSPQTGFEIVCKNTTAAKVALLAKALSPAHQLMVESTLEEVSS